MISCDAYTGNLQPYSVFQGALDRTPVAIILYSTAVGSCELTGFATTYDRIYTTRGTEDSRKLESDASGDNPVALIGTRETVANASMGGSEANGSGAGSGSGQSTSGNNTNSWGPSPSTAVAMIM